MTQKKDEFIPISDLRRMLAKRAGITIKEANVRLVMSYPSVAKAGGGPSAAVEGALIGVVAGESEFLTWARCYRYANLCTLAEALKVGREKRPDLYEKMISERKRK